MKSSVASLRVSAECTQCKTHLIAPEGSEFTTKRETTHIWHCPICGNEFETVDNFIAQRLSDDAITQPFLPSLLVA